MKQALRINQNTILHAVPFIKGEKCVKECVNVLKSYSKKLVEMGFSICLLNDYKCIVFMDGYEEQFMQVLKSFDETIEETINRYLEENKEENYYGNII